MRRAAALVIVGALCALLPGCWTEQTPLGSCADAPPFDNVGVFSASALAEFGEMAIVAKDGSAMEVNNTCVHMSFSTTERFTLMFTNGTSSTVTLSGNYTTSTKIYSITLPIIGVLSKSAQSMSLGTWDTTTYPGVLGEGKLYPTFISSSLAIFKTCIQDGLTTKIATYVGVPLSKAKDNTACNCEWIKY